MRSIIFSVCFLFITCSTVLGQGVYKPPSIPAKSIKTLDEAVLACSVSKAEESITTIKNLIAKYPTWIKPRQKLSQILYESGRRKEAIEVLKSSIAIDTFSQLSQLFTLGRLYEETGDPVLAMKTYESVIRLANDKPELSKRVNANLNSLREKRKLWETDQVITLHPLPPDINTPNEESLGRWTLDGKELIFTRLLNDQEDIFISKFDSSSKLEIQDFPFNSNVNEGAHAISPDGKYLVFTSCDRNDGFGSCDLYLSVKKNSSWTRPVNMGSSFNTPSWESQPCFGLDAMSLYFSSSRPGGYGGRDIWVARQISDGNWSKPLNAGAEINTVNNEASPFIHFDGRTMYFMRDGKEGLGGYDLYISRLGIDGHWQTPENMAAPINSGTDEGALSLHPDGRTALITKMTEQQRNDLFEFQLPEKYLSPPMQGLQVTVIDEETKKPLHARLEVFEVVAHDTIRNSQWADESGKITMAIEKNKAYGLIATAEEHLMHSIHLDPDSMSIRKFEIELSLVKSAVNKTFVLENIFFSFGSAALLPSSEPELNNLLGTLENNPGMKIEIRGHTDNVGTEEDNQQLSEERAKSVYQYLINHHIDVSRLSYKGFGETKPVVTNDTETGRKQNRRTEFVIVKI